MWFISVFYYQVCSTYPQLVVVPKSVDDETITQAACFRQSGRFPVLSYHHKANGVSKMLMSVLM